MKIGAKEVFWIKHLCLFTNESVRLIFFSVDSRGKRKLNVVLVMHTGVLTN